MSDHGSLCVCESCFSGVRLRHAHAVGEAGGIDALTGAAPLPETPQEHTALLDLAHRLGSRARREERWASLSLPDDREQLASQLQAAYRRGLGLSTGERRRLGPARGGHM